jgi:hypothetical protein
MSFSVDSFSAAPRDVLCCILYCSPIVMARRVSSWPSVSFTGRESGGPPFFFFIINRHEERTSWKCCARAERGYLYYIYNVSSYIIARENIKAKMKRSSSLSLSLVFPCDLRAGPDL